MSDATPPVRLQPVAPKTSPGCGCGFWTIIVIVIIAIFVIVAMTVPKQTSSSPSGTPVSKVPEGFYDFGDGIGIKALDTGCGSTTFAKACGAYSVYAYKNCPNLVYVEANIMDDAGTIYEMTNATVGSMKVGDVAVIELATFKNIPGTPTAKITKANCQ